MHLQCIRSYASMSEKLPVEAGHDQMHSPKGVSKRKRWTCTSARDVSDSQEHRKARAHPTNSPSAAARLPCVLSRVCLGIPPPSDPLLIKNTQPAQKKIRNKPSKHTRKRVSTRLLPSHSLAINLSPFATSSRGHVHKG